MDKNSSELSPRYYPAEITVWILAAILVLYKLLGLEPDQPLPFLNIKLQNQIYFPHIVSATLFVILMYLFLELKQSNKTAKENLLTYFRVTITTLWSVLALWLILPELVKNTAYKDVSPAWYLGFLSIGFLLGLFVQILSFSILMIRSPNEAKILYLPRIPNATKAQFIVCGPIVILLLIGYLMMHFFAPRSIVHIASLLTSISFLYMVIAEFVFLFMYRDGDGNIIPYKKRIYSFKEIHSFHDRSIDLINYGRIAAADIDVSLCKSPKEIQDRVRESIVADIKNYQPVNFHVQQLEAIQIQFYPKDGNPENLALENSGFKIHKKQGDKNTIHVLFKPDTPKEHEVKLLIPTSKVEKYAENYIAAEPENTEPDYIKIFSKAINQTVLETLQEQADPLLPAAAMAGDIAAVQELIRQGHDVNARGEGGWTALLFSSAQGYPKIMKVLLDAGANPDICNVLGITPLIYGARYENMEIVKMLIDYGADINLRDKHGDTALMKATEFGNIKVIDILIQAGADITIKNSKKQNALDLAYERGQGKIAKKIRKAFNKRVNQTA